VADQPTFAQLVSLACHDLRTPLATASGFAHTLQRLDALDPPADRYIEMIGAASEQMAQLLDLLGAAARIEAGRFEPQARELDSRELADAAARGQGDEATVEGEGASVVGDAQWAQTSLAALGECIRRHGALNRVTYLVDRAEIAIGPVRDGVGPIALGDDLRDFSSAVGVRVLKAMDAAVEVDGERLLVRLRQA
jgi:signal transduction histidine kinase